MANLYDVVAYNAEATPLLFVGRNLEIDGATSMALGFNSKGPGASGLVAVTVPAGSVNAELSKPASEEAPSDEPEEEDDSEDELSKEVVEAKRKAHKHYLEIADARTDFVRAAYKRHLRLLEAATEHIYDSGDLGIVGASLEELGKLLDNHEEGEFYETFAYGQCGDWRNEELEAVLGIERD